jgi:hypothetical protein
MRQHKSMESVRVTGTRLVISMLCAIALTSRLGAQANLASQGFGYAPGQLSTRAVGTGGAVGEMDPWSPLNPASIGILTTRLLFFQAEPEFRTVETPNGIDRTSVARFPVVFGAMPVGQRWVISFGSSTLLDRTSATSAQSTQIIRGDTVNVTTTVQANGAVNDLRLAGAWTPQNWIRLGVGIHGLTGRNLVQLRELFGDTLTFSQFGLERNLSFSGSAFSAGAQVFNKAILGAIAWRHGGTLRVSALDTTLGTANVPDRLGISLAYIGIANSAIAVRATHENWSAVEGLGSSAFKAVDAWDTSVGADMAGPRFFGRQLQLRGGFRSRTLPFQAAGNDVTERSIAAGLGSLWGGGHVITDFGVLRSSRSAGLPTSEKSWTISFGISVRQ